jgi:DNA-binding transcriptional LysR family regulator
MDIRWLEDFVALADTRNFSKAAKERHVTQPAFSRRIQALEAWVGAALVDRSTYPTVLTPAGQLFREQASDMLRQLLEARGLARGQLQGAQNMLTVAAGHTLAVTCYAPWMAKLRRVLGPVPARLMATNVHDAVLALVESGCDLLLCYSHSQFSIDLDKSRHISRLVGRDTLMPVSVPGVSGAPLHDIRGRKAKSADLVVYSSTSFLGHLLDPVLRTLGKSGDVSVQGMTDRSEAVRAMVLEGFGAGWIPASMIVEDLASGRLVPAGNADASIDLQIRIFRSLENRKPMVERVWSAAERIAPTVYLAPDRRQRRSTTKGAPKTRSRARHA